MENLVAHDAYGDLTVSLRLISPSLGLSELPDLTDLSVHTTVGQVKHMIEDVLTERNRSPFGMRVIYRGRVLDIDAKTLAEVFGIDTIQRARLQVLHLVLRNGGTEPLAETAAEAAQPPGLAQNPFATLRAPTLSPTASEFAIDDEEAAPPTPHPFNVSLEDMPASARQRFYEMYQEQQFRQQLRTASHEEQQQYIRQQWRQHASTPCIPREPSYLVDFIDPNLPNAAQEEAEELAFQQLRHIHYMQQQTFDRQPPPGSGQSVESQRQRLLSYQYLEEGQLRGTVEKRRRDRLHQPEQPQAERPEQPQVRLPVQFQGQPEARTQLLPPILSQQQTNPSPYPTHGAAVLQQRHVPALHRATIHPEPHVATTTSASVGQQPVGSPNLYLLQSPTEPRAVLINSNAGTNATPFRQAVPATQHVPISQGAPSHITREEWFIQTINQQNLQIQNQHQYYQSIIRQHMRHVEVLHGLQYQQAQQNHLQQQAAVQHDGVGNAAQLHALNAHTTVGAAQQGQVPDLHQAELRPNNPGAGAVAAMWPYVWLLVRLTIFVWWFTTPTASWTRWTTVIMVAIFLFVFNTGVLDEAFNQALAPVRAHFDGFIHGPNAAGVAVQHEGVDGQAGRAAPETQNVPAPTEQPTGQAAATSETADESVHHAVAAEPDPYAAAARLVAERRRNNGRRLMSFARWLERAGIMFIASLAPGIAERHVALAEERDREERRRLQEAAEAQVHAENEAVAAAAAAAAALSEESKVPEAEIPGALQATVEDDDLADLDEQWRNEEQVQFGRVATQ
ncbi:hypothetical protein SEPCBS57363_006232 [Sporothrix epigloea]|uniref:Ubiquitin-like domain-containing protein n=1 Tax=Sporothrix epigloea TaxID=1892477 RepID=A0ABP0E549_9PEZI